MTDFSGSYRTMLQAVAEGASIVTFALPVGDLEFPIMLRTVPKDGVLVIAVLPDEEIGWIPLAYVRLDKLNPADGFRTLTDALISGIDVFVNKLMILRDELSVISNPQRLQVLDMLKPQTPNV